MVQQVYDHLSRERTMTGDPVFLFWDQKCLNYGMNWEQGFLAGLTNAAIIVLLISLPVLIFYLLYFIHFNDFVYSRHWMELRLMQPRDKTTSCWNII